MKWLRVSTCVIAMSILAGLMWLLAQLSRLGAATSQALMRASDALYRWGNPNG